jgi:atypical dual specificity phosphatase
MSAEVLQHILGRVRDDPDFRQRLFERPLSVLKDFDLTEDEKLNLVLPDFGWLIEDCLAGTSRPRTHDAFGMLRSLGVTALLSLSELPLPDVALAHFGFQAVCVPIADFTAPTTNQVQQAISAIERYIDMGHAVAVTCGAGLGRTGTILACYLVWQGVPAEQAIASVRARRPGSIETPEQEAAVAAYAQYLTSGLTQHEVGTRPDRGTIILMQE